jgi:hypothetical protein
MSAPNYGEDTRFLAKTWCLFPRSAIIAETHELLPASEPTRGG